MLLRRRGTLLVCLATAGLALDANAQEAAVPNDDVLTSPLQLDTVLRAALLQSPLLGEARARVRASADRVDASGRRPDPELTYQQWSVPLTQPWALQHSDMVMVGLSQSFPARGSLPAERRAAESEARIVASDLQTRALDLAAQVKRAFAAYALADEELGIRREHLDLTRQLTELARVQYGAGRLTQEDVLRTTAEAARVESALFMTEQERRSAIALLNTLMGRAVDAPLGAPVPTEVDAPSDLAELGKNLDARRPEIAASSRAVERNEALLEAARAQSRWPMLMAGVDLVYDPMRAGAGYSAMVGMTLPWLNPGRDATVRAAGADREAQEYALDAVRLNARFELADATARVDAARRSMASLDERVLPEVRRGFDAARASFVAGSSSSLGLLDSLRSLLQTRIDRTRAAYLVATSLADLERAAGLPLPLPVAPRS